MRWPDQLRSSMILLLAAGLLFSACARQAARPTLTPVSLQLYWTHQAQFSGVYAADQSGDYAAEGLAVSLREGAPPKSDPFSPVLEGKAHFGVASADELILERSQGKRLRAIAAIYRRSPVVFLARAESGITRPRDFVGKRIRVASGVQVVLHAMMARVGLRPNQYTEVMLPSDLALFTSGKADVWGVYLDGFATVVQRAGLPTTIIYPDDYGIHFYGDVIFTTEDLINKNPGLINRFLTATLKGWTFVVEHPDKAGPMVVKYRPAADPALEVARLTAGLPLISTGEDRIGWMRAEVWERMARTLHEQGVVTSPVDPSAVYTMQFVHEVYQERP